MKLLKTSIAASLIFSSLFQNTAHATVQEISLETTAALTAIYYTRTFTADTISSHAYAGNLNAQSFSRYFELFTLPDYVPGTSISAAILNFSYEVQPNSNRSLELYGTNATWTNFGYYQQPKPVTGILGKVPAKTLEKTSTIDLTEYVNAAYQSGADVSFVFKSTIEASNWNDFVEFKPGQKLNIIIASAVPEADRYAMLLAGLGLIGFTILQRRRTRIR